MKASSLCILFLCLGAAWAQTAAPPPATLPDVPDDTVIAIFGDGTKLTMAEFKRIYNALPPANQQMALRDRAQWLHQWEMMRKLTKMAEQAKLDQESPYKEAIDYGRMNVLATAQITATVNAMTVEPAEIVKSYDSNKQKYTQVKVKAIYVAFSDDAAASTTKGKKPLTEAEAKAKVEKLKAALKGGADFVKLVKENSDDETSREKGGDFATLRYTDNIPDAFRAAVFALKKGDVSEPLKQPNGFYLLRAEEVTVSPLSEVRDDIYNQLKNDRATQWLDQVNRDSKVQIMSQEFVGHPAAPPAPPKAPAAPPKK
uniref:PpiC-type peptidyl-prolyl cis-trans isomerase n=1 Tax=Solibacter usitatus (strain Ellin6076) TaxID=234267 RepID=Q02AM9_SOLUE